MAVKTGCRALREQDEYHCAFCGYRWAVDDDPPPCKSLQERMRPSEPRAVGKSPLLAHPYRRTRVG